MKITTKPSKWLLDDLHLLAESIRWSRANGMSDAGILNAVLLLLDDWVPPPRQPGPEPEPPTLPGMSAKRGEANP